MIATWFGPDSAPLFGTWHLPDGGHARSVAVLCAPLGREQLLTHRAYRVLADRLVARDVAVLRFDYFGTGDSAGDGESPDLVASWLAGIDTAVAHARASGATHVTLVGLRMGAVLAGLAAEGHSRVDQLVAWNPCASGSSFLREERTLRRLSLPDVPLVAPDGRIEASGSVYSDQTVTDLSPLRLPVEASVPTLLVLRDDRPVTGAVAEFATSAAVERLDAVAHDRFLDVVDIDAMPPTETIDSIAAWIATNAPTAVATLDVRPRQQATMSTPDGGTITERIVPLGPNRLFAIASQPYGLASPTTVLFTPTATNYHPNVARIAVDVGRRLASSGYRSVRYDAFDLGDSPHGARADGPRYYTPEGTRDATDAARACEEMFGGELALVGLCSGAWVAATVIPEIQPSATYLLNPLIWTHQPAAMSPVEPSTPSFVARMFNRAQRLPGVAPVGLALWRLLATLHLVERPSAMLDTPRHRSTRITVLLGPWESTVLERRFGFGEARRLKRRPHLRIASTTHEDHSLLTATLRGDVSDQLVGWIDEDANATSSAHQRHSAGT